MRRARGGALAAGLVLAACGGGGSTGTGGAGATGGGGAGHGGATSSSTTASSTTSSTAASSGSGGAPVCTPGDTAPCYTGPFGTEGVGECKGGTKTCAADGSGYGACAGEVTPQPETCLTPGDEDCNGMANEGGDGCVCIPGSQKLCYSGPAGTAGVGICIEGILTCLPGGTGYGPCEGEVTPQPEDCTTPTDEDCDGQTPLCPPLFARRFGDAAAQIAWGLAVDAAGNVVVAGDLVGTVDLGGGTLTSAGLEDVLVAKLDPTGAHVWSKRFGDAATQSARGVAVGPAGEVVITGYFQGAINFGGAALSTAGGADIFVAKLDAAGGHVWSKRFGSATDDQLGLAVAVDPSGNVLVTGSYPGVINFGGSALTSAGGADIFVLKLDGATGAHVWSKRFGDAALVQEGRGIAADAQGNVLVTGGFEGTVNFGGAPLTSAGGTDAFLAKLDPTGAHLASARFGDVGYQEGLGVAVDAAGNVVLAGTFAGALDAGGGPLPGAGNLDGFVALFDPNLVHKASVSLGGAGNDAVTAVAVAGGAVAITGYFEGPATIAGTKLPGAGGRDIFVAKLSGADLAGLWARGFGDAAFYQSGQGVGLDAAGNTVAGGYFLGSADFGLGTLTSAGDADVFVVKLPP